MSHDRSYLSGLEGVKDLAFSGTQPRCTSLLDRLDLVGLVSGKHVQNVRWLEPSCTDLLRVIGAAASTDAIKACYKGLQVVSISFLEHSGKRACSALTSSETMQCIRKSRRKMHVWQG